jgi:pentatricopeptide repeat protein
MNSKRAATQIFKLCQKIKSEKIKPDLNTYYGLLSAARALKDPELASHYYEELKTIGLKPDANCINILLKTPSPQISHLTSIIFDLAKEDGIELNSNSYDLALQNYHKAGSYELALDLFNNIQSNESLVVPSMYITLIKISIEMRDVELVEKFSKLAFTTKNRFSHSDLFALLRGYLEMDLAELSFEVWDHLVEVQRLLPDQGLTEMVLSASARWGNSKLATSVLRVFSEQGIPCEDYHFIPLIEVFLKSKQWDRGIQIMNMASQANIKPSLNSLVYFRRQLRSQHADLMEATSYIMDKARSGVKLPREFIFYVLESNLLKNETEQGLDLLNILKKQHAPLSLEYYNTIIKCFADNKQTTHCTNFYSQMKADGIKPNEVTYTQLIKLYCEEDTYEESFKLLEEMKSSDIVPSSSCYTTLLRKCAMEKDERVYLVMEEMDMFGYTVADKLRLFVESRFKEEN